MPLAQPVPAISPMVLRFFRRIVRGYFRRHFRSVLCLHLGRLRDLQGPVIIYGNHSSWWDPMLIVLLGDLLLSHRNHYAPIDARAAERYPILRRLGIFPVELSSPRGAAQFLRTAESILHSGGVLWLTPQGRFADPREFPLAFKPGLAALALRMPEIPLIPLAVEYTFWNERLPETLMCVGNPVHVTPGSSVTNTTASLEAALANSMLELQHAVVKRDPAFFEPVLRGARGTGGMYAVIQRIGSLLKGKRLNLDHTNRADRE